jgi:hypothetical protein
MDGNLAMTNQLENTREPIKEINGWKLYKESDLHHFEVETPEGCKQVFRHPSFNILEFEKAVERGWIWIDVEFFTTSIVNSKIVISKQKKQIRSNLYNSFLINHNLNENELRKKMKPTLIKANEKFKKCKDAFEKLQKEFEVDINYTMEGDTHGIYEDHLNMTFRIDGVYCYYKLEN